MPAMKTLFTTAALAAWLAAPGAGALAQDASGPSGMQGDMPMMHMEAGKEPTASAQGYMDAMAKMNRDMSSMQMSGDPDVDFARMMIPHHQSAIDMARIELEHGKDETLKAMAQKVIEDQQREIDELQSWLDRNARQ
jgi:uncharacterized protein (DUF305 family)